MSETREIKVGDKVRIVKEGHTFDGDIATITRVPNLPINEYTVELPLDGWPGRTGNMWYKRDEFELVENEDTQDTVSWWRC